MMQSDFLNRLKCDILRCWSWVGKYWHNSSISSSTDWVVVRFLQRNVPVRHIRPNLSMSGKNTGLPTHSFTAPPLSSVSLPPSVSAWHAGCLPDHQPVSNDSLVWRRGRTANLHSSQLPVCKPVYIHYSQPSMNALKGTDEERQLPVIAAASNAGALQSVNCRVSGFLSRCHH